MAITANVKVPPRSRMFSAADARQVLALMNGTAEGQEGPAETVGYGTFKSQGAARSAGVALNRLLRAEGAEHPYAVTTVPTDGGSFMGVLLNRRASERKPLTEQERKARAAKAKATRERNKRAQSRAAQVAA